MAQPNNQSKVKEMAKYLYSSANPDEILSQLKEETSSMLDEKIVSAEQKVETLKQEIADQKSILKKIKKV